MEDEKGVREVRFEEVIRSKADLEGWKLVLRKGDMVIRNVPLSDRFFALLRSSETLQQQSSSKKAHRVELQGKELKVVLDELLQDAEHALLESEMIREEMECLSPKSEALRNEKRKYKRRSHFRQSKDGTMSPLSPLSEDDFGDSPIPHDMFDDLDTTLNLFRTVEATPPISRNKSPVAATPKLVTPKRFLEFQDIQTPLGIGGYVFDYRRREMPSSSLLTKRSTRRDEKKNHESFVKTFMSPILPKGLESVLSDALLSSTLLESKGEAVS